MESLRTKREAPGKGRQPTARLAKPNGANATPRRDARKSRVDDKIRKRMSMRYADISGPADLAMPPIPAIPTMPTRTTPGKEQDEVVMKRTGREDRREDDKKLFDQDDFDPDAFLKLKLANSTEYEIKSLQSSLRNAQDDTSSELQRNVFKNYAEFVLISKEISTLENEMLELKESLSEYKSMPSLLHIPDPTSTSSSGLSSYRRSSVADLRIMYFNQMQTLHSQIEGSAKFAPTTPGRHVVAEIEGVIALNAATYKPTGKAKFVVLDDAVLVARRRRRAGASEGRSGGSNEGKLVAERCWPLNEMLVLDTKDSPSMTNVFKIRHGKETHVYRTETPSEKKSLLSQFRQVAEELSAKKRKEREGEHERRKSLWVGGTGGGDGNSNLPPMPDWMSDLARKMGDPDTANSDAKEKAERDARWTSEWADELTVAIALREWDRATDLVEQGRAKVNTTPPVAAKLPVLTGQLTNSLLQSLSQTANRKSTVILIISLLLRLNAGPAARTTFLNMRSQVMRNHVRKIRFEGHIGAYIGDLSIVFFTGIKNTADWYLNSFKDNEGTSAFIDWAKKQIEDYGELFRRQVYSVDVDRKVVDEALMITRAQSKKLLQDYGLDFRFLFSDVLSENPKNNVTVPPNFTLKGHQVAKPPRHTPAALNLSIASSTSVSSTLLTAPLASSSSTSSFSNSTATPIQPSASREQLPTREAPPRDTPSRSNNRVLPTPAPLTIQPDLPSPLVSPSPRRTRSPPPSAGYLPRTTTPGLMGARERPPRSGRPAGITSPPPVTPTGPPPRSANRPGSAISRPPVALPQREGMF
ncbi:Exocyst complex component [Mycena indigotica]|uniref:Exocyst complex component EXO84 n=1 Tax=Mycena indigotica TaxID=2126181 RepID=A0A8H6SYZ0_9AGAR|nr:Exocyst complex component [Mycena indigotica]KAF7307226.1 Exocyst complex component [Mycena indigotica]